MPQPPKSVVPGFTPTLNKRGFMADRLDPVSEAFVDYALGVEGEVLDMGCAYGVASLPALAGGARVCACDMEPGHLAILTEKVPVEARSRLTCRVATLPDVDFPDAAFAAILCARVLHFLRGEDITCAIGKMCRWLVPGGRLFLVADTPYTGFWKVLAPVYESKKRQGDPWPGLIEDFPSLLPDSVDKEGHPAFLNPLDPDLLARECRRAGFEIMSAGFLASLSPRGGEAESSRAHAGVIARKPE